MLDGIFVVFVCVLAFLLASTPARNSDLWLHLASGRWLVQGHSPRGTDPFTSTAANVLWVNHTWLGDVLLYGLYTIGGGKALVLAKAFLAAILAGLFFCFRRRGTPVGLHACAAGVAVLALGPGLWLQPALLSLVGVVLTLYLLERPTLVEPERVVRARALRWLLVPLFALWANLDGWFLLGPVLVGLYALGSWRDEGEGMRDEGRQKTADRRTPWTLSRFIPHPSSLILFFACLAACLLTPYHYRTFAWPGPLGLSHAERALMSDPLGDGLVVSPFGARFVAAPVFASPGAWAYYLLLAGGLVTFAWRGRSLHLGRLLAWLALAALSAYQARAIPFFAVLAGPVLVLNLRTGASSRALAPTWRQLRAAGRGALALVGLALLVLAWPGWLQPAPYRPRGWTVEPDASLVRLAEQLQQWHAQEQVPDDHFALTLSPDAAHHLAWFCPAEKGFLDSRWPLFDGVADDFVRMRRCLLQSGGAGPDPELGPLLDAYRIDRIIVRDPDWDRTARAYRCLLGGREWELLALEGGAAVFGRRPPAGARQSGRKVFDRRRLAYHPPPQRRAPPAPARPPQRPGPLAAFCTETSGVLWKGSPDREEAALHLISFDLAAEHTRRELGAQWHLIQATGLLGCQVPASEGAATATALAVRLSFTPLLVRSQESGVRSQESPAPGQQAADQVFAGFLARRDQEPAEALLLAVRASRRALAANPDDAGALLLLGEAYLRLARQTREQSWHGNLPTLTAIRRYQALTALEQAVLLRPDLDQAHALLVRLYWAAGHLDRALDHLRARLQIAEGQASKRGPGAASAVERRPVLEADADTLRELVDRSLAFDDDG